MHSFAGFGIEQLTPEKAAFKMSARTKINWQNAHVLVIDEISMAHGWYLDLLEQVGRRVRKRSDEVFGGLRVIMVGDFMQLPPVGQNPQFVFDGAAWKAMKVRVLRLGTQHRQTDARFIELLGHARLGQLTPDDETYLRARVATTPEEKAARLVGRPAPSYLYPRNAEVDSHNERELAKLPGDVHEFRARDENYEKGSADVFKHLQAPELLRLKVGAEIIFLTNENIHGGWFNGARGKVVKFKPKGVVRVQLHANGDKADIDRHEFKIERGEVTLARRHQLPLRLAWAVSCHKSQGLTINGPVIAPLDSSVFEYGQAYVVLSRVRRAEDLILTTFRPQCVRAHPRAIQFETSLPITLKRHRDGEEDEPEAKRARLSPEDIDS